MELFKKKILMTIGLTNQRSVKPDIIDFQT